MKKHLLFLYLLLGCSTIFAQQNLPYFCGFDSTVETSGWQEYREGVSTTFNWSVSNTGGVSAPAMLYHDYPVGAANTDTTEDWYVSPALLVTGAGAKLSFKYNVYSITGNATDNDNFSVWYSTTGANPASAAYQKAADFTLKASTSTTWLDSNDILLNGSGTMYLAFRYKAINNWFVISVDNVSVVAQPASSITEQGKNSFAFYPNPAHGSIQLINTGDANVSIYDLSGRLQLRKAITGNDQLDVTKLMPGIYFIELVTKQGDVTTRKVTIY
ncbi:MAG: T9SS type A sorting domain-containing protein [Chitinophagales bacterium]